MFKQLPKSKSPTARIGLFILAAFELMVYFSVPTYAQDAFLSADYGLQAFKPAAGEYAGLIVDASDARWTVANSKNEQPTWSNKCDSGTMPINKYPVTLDSQHNSVFRGGLIKSNVPQDSEWKPTYCNSAAIAVFRSNNATIDRARITGAWDGVRFAQGSNDFTLSNSWISNVRDDCVENDQLRSGRISNTLFDGCNVGISVRPGANDDQPSQENVHTVTLDGVLMRMNKYPWRKRQSDRLRTTHAHIFKIDSRSPSFVVQNSVFAYEADDPYADDSNLTAGFSKTVSCSNNYALWLSENPLPSYFSSFPESCFTILKGQAAIDHWISVRENWIACHPDIARLDSDESFEPTSCSSVAGDLPSPPILLDPA